MVWFVDNGNVWEICMYGKYEILDQSNKQALYIVCHRDEADNYVHFLKAGEHCTCLLFTRYNISDHLGLYFFFSFSCLVVP